MFLHDLCFFLFFFFFFKKCNIIIYLNFCNYLYLSFQMTDKSDLRGRSIQFLSLSIGNTATSFLIRKKASWIERLKRNSSLLDRERFQFSNILLSKSIPISYLHFIYIRVSIFVLAQIPKVIQVEKIRQKYYFKFKRKKINDSL